MVKRLLLSGLCLLELGSWLCRSYAQSGIRHPPSAIANPYLFQGARYDAETGLYYFRNRYYDPQAGRFLQRDPAWDPGNVGNGYTFVGNNPFSRFDPLGLSMMIRGHVITRDSTFYKDRAGNKFAKELLDRMIDSKQPYTFNTQQEFDQELTMRKAFIACMQKHAGQAAGITYSAEIDEISAPAGSGWDSNLTYQGDNPSKAIDDLEKGPTKMECRRMISFCMWKALRDTIGKVEFNRRFRSKKIKISIAADDTPSRCRGTDILPGDWVYFKNVPEYPENDPRYLWRGENAVYEGDDQYSGFGITSKSSEEMRQELLNAYHRDVPTGPKKDLSDVPEAVVEGSPSPGRSPVPGRE